MVDDAIGKEILRVVRSAAVDAAVVASEAAAHQQDEVLKAWTRELEAARYAARRPETIRCDRSRKSLSRRRVGATLEYRIAAASAKSKSASINTCTAAVSPWSPPEKNSRIWQRTSRPSGGIRMRMSDSRNASFEHSFTKSSWISMPMPVRSFWSFTGKARFIPNCDCRRRRRGQSATHTSKDVVDAVRVLARICPDDLPANVLNRNRLLTGRGNRRTRAGRLAPHASRHRLLRSRSTGLRGG